MRLGRTRCPGCNRRKTRLEVGDVIRPHALPRPNASGDYWCGGAGLRLDKRNPMTWTRVADSEPRRDSNGHVVIPFECRSLDES